MRNAERDVLAGAEDVLADQAESLGVGDGLAEALDRQRILAADVVVASLGAAGDAGDQHAFEDPVRIALVDAAVLVDVRLAFVGVADDELGRGPRLAAAFPLDAGREAGAAAAAQIRGGDLGDGLFCSQLEQDLEVGAVGAAGDGVFDRVGIDDPDVFQDDAVLVLEEGVLVERRDRRRSAFSPRTPTARSSSWPASSAATSAGSILP